MTPRGLIKLTNAANNFEAWRDWQKITDEAIRAGRYDLVEQHAPPVHSTWRIVDKHIAALRKALQEAKA
mgnify:CR=1 FL=1